MSKCISRQGEYSEHQFGTDAERFLCDWCGVFDEDAAIKALENAEARIAAALSILETTNYVPAKDALFAALEVAW